jgi:peroxiredoxin
MSIAHRGEPGKDSSQPVGRLEMQGVRLHGCLVNGAELSHPGCLAWRPRGCAAASALSPDASGVIVYRDPPPPQPLPNVSEARRPVNRRAHVAAPGANWLNVLAGVKIKPETGEAVPSTDVAPVKTTACLYLIAGDAIPCKIARIDDRGVWFESSKYQATFAPHESIKAIDLENASVSTKINPTKRDRMLTLPRMRRDDPPRHLVRSVDGDYLLANVVAMDDRTLKVEVRLEERQLPRGKIARIIWLHEGEAAKRTTEPRHPSAMLVQALRRDGNRLSLLFEGIDGVTLFGTNATLGPCRIELGLIDQLFFGAIPVEIAKTLPYQRWKLHAAQDPTFAQDGKAEGTESALVGKAAPDFELPKVDGPTFRLSQQRGKIVVLDFWASWCGACIEVLPQITQMAEQFKGEDVLLVAVNLQENPRTIRTALDRLHVNPMVALDESGSVAQKYGATAIPQTVIIDRAGRVARVFVGGGPQYVENVRESLRKILDNRDGRPNSK